MSAVVAASSPGADPEPPQLFVSGSIGGMYPGSTGLLSARISNTFDHSVVVESLTTAPQPARAGCDRYMHVGDLVGQRTVPPNSSISVTLATSFDWAAPDACQNIVIPLVFTVNQLEAASPPPIGELPLSGTDSRPLMWLAAAALAAGMGIAVMRRRRPR